MDACMDEYAYMYVFLFYICMSGMDLCMNVCFRYSAIINKMLHENYIMIRIRIRIFYRP